MIIAIDPSLTSTGLAVLGPVHNLDTGGPYWAVRTIRSQVQTTELGNFRRMQRITGEVRSCVEELTPEAHLALGVIEAPAYSKSMGKSHERSGLWWMLYAMLVGYGMPVLVVRPNLRSKYATGIGTAGKDEVQIAAVRRYPDVPISNNNEADAAVLAAMGARYLGVPIDQLPKTHLAAMTTLSV